MASQRAECTVSGPLAFVLRISQAIGVAPLQFKRSLFVWRICVSPTANMYGIVLTIFLCCLAFAALLKDISLRPEKSYDPKIKMILAIYCFNLIVIMCFGLIWSFMGTNRMKCVIKCLNTTQTINLKLDDYCCSTRSNKASWQLITFALTCGILIFVSMYILNLYKENSSRGKVVLSIMYLSNVFIQFAAFVLMIQVTIIIMTPLSTLKRVNSCLEVLHQKISSEDSNKSTTLRRDIEVAVCNFARYHVNICAVIRQIDKSHGTVYIGFIFSLFLQLIISLYQCLNISDIKGELANYTQSLLIVWIIFHTSCLIIIVEPCHRTQEEVENTKRILRRMLSKVPTSDHVLNKELGRFFTMLTLKRVTYSPMSMITLNRSLYVSMVASITTYLVIVMGL